MNWFFSTLPRLFPQQWWIGCGASTLTHAGGLAAAILFPGLLSLLLYHDEPIERPKLIGEMMAADAALSASWSQPEPPTPEIEIAEPIAAETPAAEPPQVVVMPERAVVADRTFFEVSTDVSNPTPMELAMAERMMRRPSDPTGAHEPPAPESRPAERPSPTRRTPAPAVSVATPPSVVQETSVGEPDVRPKLLTNRPPRYPEPARAARQSGTTLLRVHVTAEGTVAELEVFRSSGHAILDATALRAARDWRFRPAMQDGRPVAHVVRLPVLFQLPD